MQDLLTTAEVAEVLGTSERMVHYYVRRKDAPLKVARQIGRVNLFDPTTVALFKPTIIRRNWARQIEGAA